MVFAPLVWVPREGTATPLKPVSFANEDRKEQWLRDFLFAHPGVLPAEALDPAFAQPVPICREMRAGNGFIDVFFATPTGALVVVECKLWRNPQARREVVAQLLDYAKELARWRYEDLQREVSTALKRPGENALFKIVQQAHAKVQEAEFVDRVSRNLAQGRFLLLIAGDGIHEGTESIARYIAEHAGLRFTLGLVEVAGFEMPGGGLLVQPRLLARTVNMERVVFRQVVDEQPEEADEAPEAAVPSERGGRTFSAELKAADRSFWQDFKARLKLDDPEVGPPRTGFGRAYLDIGSEAHHLTIFSARSSNQIGAFIGLPGEEGRLLYQRLYRQRRRIGEEIASALPGVELNWHDWEERCVIRADLFYEGKWSLEQEATKLRWLLKAANAFVNAFRPRILRLESSNEDA
jgi:hypothetical protein